MFLVSPVKVGVTSWSLVLFISKLPFLYWKFSKLSFLYWKSVVLPVLILFSKLSFLYWKSVVLPVLILILILDLAREAVAKKTSTPC
jgi:hypothetical protein